VLVGGLLLVGDKEGPAGGRTISSKRRHLFVVPGRSAGCCPSRRPCSATRPAQYLASTAAGALASAGLAGCASVDEHQ